MADPLSAGIGAGISALGSFASSIAGGHQARKNMRLQAALNYKYAKKSALESPTWNRKGLTDAGYNPMLAVQNATSGTNSSWSGLGTQDSPDFAGAVSSGIANAQSFKRLQNETDQTEANVEQAQATARKENAIASNEEERNPYISKSEQANLNKLDAETSKLNRETDYYDALEENMKVLQDLQHESNLLDYNARIYGADKSYNASTYHADKLKEIADEHSPTGKSMSFRNYMEGISAPIHGIGSLLHGGNGRYIEESIENTYDKNGNIKGAKTKSKTRKRK